jgi:predicted nucleic acid-binding protein
VPLAYIDSGVLISAACGRDDVWERALAILDDPERTFASSSFVKLETIPKAAFNRNSSERRFYETFFAEVASWANVDERLLQRAFDEACAVGLNAADAVHVAAAVETNCLELVTSEKSTTPLHRTKLITVKSIRP